MQFSVSTTSLLKQLQIVSGALDSSAVLPILNNFLFDIEPGKLTISGSNQQTTITSHLKIDATESRKIAVPPQILLSTLKTLPEQPLTFSIGKPSDGKGSDQTIHLKTENGFYILQGEPPEGFPTLPTLASKGSFTCSAPILYNVISCTLLAVSHEDSDAAMAGVYCKFSADGTTFVATNGHKLVRYLRRDIIRQVEKKPDSAIDNQEVQTSCIIPRKALTLLKNILPIQAVMVQVSYNESHIRFKFDSTSLTCQLVDGKYPDYQSVILIQNPNKLITNRALLQGALKRLVIYANRSSNLVRVESEDSQLTISSEDTDFNNEAKESLACNFYKKEGDGILSTDKEVREIGFNARFMIEMLGFLTTEEVVFSLSASTNPILITPGEQDAVEDILLLVMPINLITT